MKRITFFLMIVGILLSAVAIVAAQDEEPTPLTLVEAIAVVREAYGDDILLTDISYDEDDACWKFEFPDSPEICVDEITGEITVDDEGDDIPTPESTEEPDDSTDDNADVLMPTITLDEAIAIALEVFPNSVVTDVELELTVDGFLVWDIDLDNDVRSVDVNAETGAIMDFGHEADDDNDYDDSDDDDSRDDNDDERHDDDDDDSDDNDGHDDDDDSDDGHDDDDDDDNSGHGSSDDDDDDNSGHGSSDDDDD